MKKAIFILFMFTFNVFIHSCTPEELPENVLAVQACCGEEGDIPPPPPPPPPNN